MLCYIAKIYFFGKSCETFTKKKSEQKKQHTTKQTTRWQIFEKAMLKSIWE